MKTQRETPYWLINKMIDLLDLKYGNHILEPSCGEGKIINTLVDHPHYMDYAFDITGVELNKEKFDSCLKNVHINLEYSHNHATNIINMDFLEFSKEGGDWDRIIACPPFKNCADQLHISSMYELLDSKGIIVSLTKHSEWMSGILGEDFRKWLSKLKHELIILPDDTFIEKRKSVPTSILVIKK